MILAAGLTPAWQHILVLDALVPGEVLRAREALWCASGKVLNAAMAAHRLGGDCRALALLGGHSRQRIEDEMRELGLHLRAVPVGSTTRTCTTLVEATEGEPTVTELVENAAPLAEGEYERFLSAFAEEAKRADVVVLIGSTPEGTPVSVYRDCLERTGGRAIIDARGENLVAALELAPFLVKPNRHELAATVGRELSGEEDIREGIRSLQRAGARWVVVTDGPGPILVAGSQGELYRLTPPRGRVVNPIGCGDCLAGGIAWALSRGRDVVDAVRIGVGASLQNLGTLLPSRVDLGTVRRLASTVEVAREC